MYERDVVDEVLASLDAAAARCVRAGIPAEHVILDPGIGFGKLPEHNLAVLRALAPARRARFSDAARHVAQIDDRQAHRARRRRARVRHGRDDRARDRRGHRHRARARRRRTARRRARRRRDRARLAARRLGRTPSVKAKRLREAACPSRRSGSARTTATPKRTCGTRSSASRRPARCWRARRCTAPHRGASPAQPAFVNAAALVDTALDPHGLLAALKRIETEAGRVTTYRWGPRVLDLDILAYGGVRLAGAEPDDPACPASRARVRAGPARGDRPALRRAARRAAARRARRGRRTGAAMRRFAAASFALALVAMPGAARADLFSSVSTGVHASTIGHGITLEKPLLYDFSVRVTTGTLSVSGESLVRHNRTRRRRTTATSASSRTIGRTAGAIASAAGSCSATTASTTSRATRRGMIRVGNGLYPVSGTGTVNARVRFDRPSIYAGVGTGTGLIRGLALEFDAGVLVRNGTATAVGRPGRSRTIRRFGRISSGCAASCGRMSSCLCSASGWCIGRRSVEPAPRGLVRRLAS